MAEKDAVELPSMTSDVPTLTTSPLIVPAAPPAEIIVTAGQLAPLIVNTSGPPSVSVYTCDPIVITAPETTCWR